MKKITERTLNLLTLKDKRILDELYEDARKPYSTIAKKVGLSKEAVAYRIKRMLDLELLNCFNTIIDVGKFGWKMFFVYLRFRHIDFDTEAAILEHLRTHPNVAWQVKCIGNYDAVVKFFARGHEEMNEIIKTIEEKFKNNIHAYLTDYVVEERAVPLTFLYDKKKRILDVQERKPGVIDVTNADLKILKVISHASRTPLTEIAKKTKLSREIVKYRLKRLEKEKVILKYRPSVWTGSQQQGYNWFFIILEISKLNPTLEKRVFSYLLNHPHVTYYYRTHGSSDIQIEVRIKTTIEFNIMLMELRALLKNVLKRHELLMILNEQKFTYFPDCLIG